MRRRGNARRGSPHGRPGPLEFVTFLFGVEIFLRVFGALVNHPVVEPSEAGLVLQGEVTGFELQERVAPSLESGKFVMMRS